MSTTPAKTTLFTYKRLRDQELAKATKPFNAKGKHVSRCKYCQLGAQACLCDYVPKIQSGVDFILLMHRNELFKPTNTGRLLADINPHCHVHLWSRTQPEAALLEMINDPDRQCFIVFPSSSIQADRPRPVYQHIPDTDKRTTFILLDGTWTQCSRMFSLGRWLDKIPVIELPKGRTKGYQVRKSLTDSQLATAEAGMLCLELAGESHNAGVLEHYFNVFNQHYLATRGVICLR